MFLFLLGKQAFNARVGAWADALYLLMPGITDTGTPASWQASTSS